MTSVSLAHTAAALPFNDASTGMVFTPFIIMVLALLLVLTLVILVTLVVFMVRSHRRVAQATEQVADDVESQAVKDAYFEVVDHGVKSASLWSRLSCWMPRLSAHEPEPELPWTVYSVLPHLRPKAPLHVRLLKAVMFWRKEEVKREPFTVADAQRAKEELEARTNTQAAAAACMVHSEEDMRRWLSSVQIPEIVIHLCDDTPCTMFNEAPAAILSKPVDIVSELGTASTMPEASSPLPLVSSSESAAVPPLPLGASLDALEMPMPSSTAPKDEEQIEESVNVSNFSGKAFVLGAPPKRKASSGLTLTTTSGDVAACVPAATSSPPDGPPDAEADLKSSAASTGHELDSPTPLPLVAESAAFSVIIASTSSATSSPTAADPILSPASTASEPASPMLLTPIAESVDFPLVIVPAPANVLDISTPSSTAFEDIKGKGEDAECFKLDAGCYRTRCVTGFDSPLRLGLGLNLEEVQRLEEEEPQFVIGELSPGNSEDSIFDDSRDEVPWFMRASSSTSSTKSVPDIWRALEEVAPESSTYSDNSSSSPTAGPSRLPFAGILEVIQRHLPPSESVDNFTIGSLSPWSTCSDILDVYPHEEDEEVHHIRNRDSTNPPVPPYGSNSINAFTNTWQASAPSWGMSLAWGAAPLRALAREWVALSSPVAG
ncbi:hypothetical protein L226DRAFT_568109 [Lentinus tigrinus ALCF2SS1-7]|uniref:uncharacterized protein n=1 Tax=Lentinus tigrinus ALCF2SS1-7 TaxID=1328758 RepID=UPI001165DDB6|nr:hypothetical protein L226DRAFT_568109 [Lentinus tigrinus ALCF2SS1-7]